MFIKETICTTILTNQTTSLNYNVYNLYYVLQSVVEYPVLLSGIAVYNYTYTPHLQDCGHFFDAY